MDSKQLLKDTKAALKNKDYKSALKLSKNIIKEDRSNYMAFVCLGLSLQELGPQDQVPKAFQKAIDLNPTNPLGYQGLISYIEKSGKGEKESDLLKLYLAYLAVETNEAKLLESSKKLIKLCNPENIIDIITCLLDVSKKCTGTTQTEILQNVADQLGKLSDINNHSDLFKNCMQSLTEASLISENLYSHYLTVLSKNDSPTTVLQHAKFMHEQFPNNVVALSWICKIFNQLFIEESPELNTIDFQDIVNCTDKLLLIDHDNAMGLFTRAVLLTKERDFSEAKTILTKVTEQRPGLIYAWTLLTDILIHLGLVKQACLTLSKTQKLLRSLTKPGPIGSKIEQQELTLLSLSDKEEDWLKCIDMHNQNPSVKCGLKAAIQSALNLKKFVMAQEYISNLKRLDAADAQLYQLRLYKRENKFPEAIKLVEDSTLNSSQWWIEVGLLYWDLKDLSKCLEPFLKAAKCDPDNYACFIHLGHYYNGVGQIEKARRCFEKAFKLNSNSSEAGSELSKIYRNQKKWDFNLALLTSLTESYADCTNTWAWFQLGLTYLEQGDPGNAIEYLRIVLRFEPENGHCWESLADAYFEKGAFTSAQKCYQKASDLLGFSLYSTLQTANIKKVLGEFKDAQADFEKVLDFNNRYVPALKGLSETHLYQAKEYLREQRIGTARDYAQIACEKVTLAILQRGELACLWKLIADCVSFVANLPKKYSILQISETLISTNKSTDATTILEQDELFETALKLYSKAVSLHKNNPHLWHDLAACYFNYALKTVDETQQTRRFDCALAAAQHCATLEPENWQHWNLLGGVAMSRDPPNYALALHAFIKAVIAESNSAVAWTNLGTLYLLLDDIKLANKAFGEGQRSDPNYVNCWIGQALIAETIGHADAMDLFRHSTQLGQHQQGSIGYGQWVCQTLLNLPSNDKVLKYNIYNMHAIPVAYDNVKWYLEKNPDDACAWNLLGVLSERMGLLESAKSAFKYALVLAESRYEDIGKTNYGRLLYRTGDFSGAIQMFKGVREATFSSGGGLALALFKNGQYEQSYAAYEQALHWLTDEQTSQSDLLVALASMAYKFQGADVAKTLLFQSIELKPPSPWSLFATLSLSLLHNDLKLSQMVLNELSELETTIDRNQSDFSEYIYHYSTLLTAIYAMTKNKTQAVTGMSKLVHRHPNEASVWLKLAEILLMLDSDERRLSAGANCANSAIRLGQKYMEVSKVLSVAALSFYRAKNLKQAAIFAQKAIHYSPNSPDGWAILLPVVKAAKPNVSASFLNKLITTYFKDETISAWSKKYMTS